MKINKVHILVLTTLAFLSFIFSTNKGIGLNVDSKIYLEGAVNINKCGTYQVFNSWNGEVEEPEKWPKGTSYILSYIVDENNITSARIKLLYLIVFCLNVVIFYNISLGVSSNSLHAFIPTCLFVIHSDIATIHYGVYSEPFYILFTLSSIQFMFNWLAKPNKFGLLLLALIFIILSIYVRYTGVFTLIGFLLFLFIKYIIQRNKFNLKSILFLIFFSLISIIFLSYSVYNNLEFAGRSFLISSTFPKGLIKLVNYSLSWINPYFTTSLISEFFKTSIALFIFILTLNTLSIKRRFLKDIFIYISILIITFVIGYVLHMLFLDPTVVTKRTFMPLLVLLILIVTRFHYLLQPLNISKVLKITYLSLLVLIFASNFIFSIQNISQNFKNGIGLNSIELKNSDIFKYIESLSNEDILYTNEPSSTYLHIRRHSYLIPQKRDFVTNKLNENSNNEILQMKDSSFLVLFKNYEKIRERWLVNKQELLEHKVWDLVFYDEIGDIYKITTNKETQDVHNHSFDK